MRSRGGLWAVVPLLPALVLAAVLAAPLGEGLTGLLSNLCQTALPLAWLPLVAAARRHRRDGASPWLGWALLAAGLVAWNLGQVVWTWYEQVLGRAVPFPSLADAGFLAFPLLAVAGLVLLHRSGASSGAGVRTLLDGLLVATSAGLLSWATVLGAVYRAGADTATSFAVSLAYPLGDLVLGVLALLALTRAPAASRASLALLGAGSAVLVVGDGAFLLGVTEGWYASGSVVDLTWVLGFGLLGCAGWVEATSPGSRASEGLPGRARALLPYLALAPALGLVVLPSLFAAHEDRVAVVASVGLLALLMLRQLVAVLENARLLAVVAAREEELRTQAFSDALTGLANRALFTERVAHAVALARRDLRRLAVLYVDLDGFKAVNDTLGHAEGDRLLVAVAERLRAAAGPADTLARLGGDEFALLLEGDTEQAPVVAARVVAAMATPFSLAGRAVRVSASVGVAGLSGPDCLLADADALLRDADTAMYAAKRRGKDTWVAFEPGMQQDAARAVALRAAVEADALVVVHQPVVDLPGGQVRAVEALVRWPSGDVGPDVFVPLAETLGLVPRLGAHVLRTALADAAAWPGLDLHVNASPFELVEPGYAAGVLDALHAAGVPPSRLVLEVTEGVLAPDRAAAVATLAALRSAGVRVALDDFGTGWSSLTRLRVLPVDVLKLDRGFVTDVATSSEARAVVAGVLAMASSLGLPVVAEGVEDAAQAQVLAGLGCAQAQGWHFGRPAPAAQLVLPAPRLSGESTVRA